MKAWNTLRVALTAVVAGAWMGCALDDASGPGGTDESGRAMFRVAHLAPGVPTSANPALDFTIVERAAFLDIAFGRVSDYVSLRPDIYLIEVAAPGSPDAPLVAVTPTLEEDGVYSLVAYRDSGEPGLVSLFFIEHGTSGLTEDQGRVVVGHAVDDRSWPSINVIDTGTNDVIVRDLQFGVQSAPVDMVAGEHSFGFDVPSALAAIDAGPFRYAVAGDAFSILVAVDNDTQDGTVDLSVYAIAPSTQGGLDPLEAR